MLQRLAQTILCSLCLLSQAFAATYFVDQAGGNDVNNGTSSATPWKTVTKVNATSFLPGDVVRFKRGGVWRDAALTISSSGTVGNPITFSDYGSGALPVFNGADGVSGWTLYSGNVYYAAWSTYSMAVFQNSTPLRRATSIANLSAGSSFCDGAGRIYVWTTTGAHPNNFTIEASKRGFQAYYNGIINYGFGLISAFNKQWLVIENLRLINANMHGIYLEGGGHYVVSGCTLERSYHNTITAVGNPGWPDTTDVTVIGNTLIDCGLGRVGPVTTGESENVGINVQGWLAGNGYNGGLVSGNTLINQGGESIQVLGGSTNVIIEKNKCINAVFALYIGAGWGNSATNGGTLRNITLRYNYVEKGSKSALYSSAYAIGSEQPYAVDGVDMYGNVAVGKGTGVDASLVIGNAGQTGNGYVAGPVRNLRIYNNVFANDFYGIIARGPSDGAITIRNNIMSVLPNGRGFWVGEALPGFYNALSNYTINSNLLYSSTAAVGGTIIEWSNGQHYTLAQWQALTGQGANSAVAEPQFANAALKDYSLKSTSPARNRGVNLGAAYQLALNPASTWPDITTLDQNQNGAWEMGAYVYPESQSLQLVSLSPTSGTGNNATFVATVSDTAGASAISLVQLTVNDIMYNASACALTYESSSNTLYLLSNDMSSATQGTVPSAVTLSNSQCSISLASASVTRSGNNLTLSVPIRFTESFAATNPTKNVYVRATDYNIGSVGYTAMGTWTVAFPPTITTQPLSQGVLAGQSATFSVVARGIPAPAYQWQKNGLNISGATGSSYATPAATVADNGASFRCIVSNSAGSVTSNAALLSVSSQAVLQLVSVAPSSGTGASVSFVATVSSSAGATDVGSVNFVVNNILYSMNACAVTYDSASNQLYLFKDDFLTGYTSGALGASIVLQNSQCSINLANARVSRSGNNLSLTLPIAFKTSFAGAKNTYLRAVSNSGSVAEYKQMGTWTVAFPPVITSQPVSLSVIAGQSATFRVVASGIPAPTYQWQKNGLNISGATSSSYTTPAATSADNGANFRCVIRNAAGSLTSNAASLTVKVALQLVSVTPSSGTGASANFVATVSSSAGAADVGLVNFVVNDILYAMNACAVTYEAASNQLHLYNDDFFTGYTSGALGTSVVLQNSQCAINLANARVARSGNNLSLTIPVAFKASFAGAKNTYLRAVSNSGSVAAYQQMGTWTVAFVNAAPAVSSLAVATPNPGTVNEPIIFSVAAADPDGQPLSYTWDFGDGTSATGESATHAYTAAGSYSASVLVSDGKGGSVRSTVVVTINAPLATAGPQSAGSVLPAIPEAEQPVSLESVSVKRSFKLRLVVSEAISGETKIRVQASGLPAGARLRGLWLYGRVKQSGQYQFTVRFTAKSSGQVVEQRYAIIVQAAGE